jgi:hypothetical protein
MRPRGLKCRIILFRIKVGVVARRQRPKQIARDLYMKEKKRVFRKKSQYLSLITTKQKVQAWKCMGGNVVICTNKFRSRLSSVPEKKKDSHPFPTQTNIFKHPSKNVHKTRTHTWRGKIQWSNNSRARSYFFPSSTTTFFFDGELCLSSWVRLATRVGERANITRNSFFITSWQSRLKNPEIIQR